MDVKSVLCCPACDTGKIEDHSCLNCGTTFEDEDGTLLLFPKSKNTTFSVKYISLEETKAALLGAFHRPGEVGASDAVYHLDKAHMPYLENLPKGSTILEVGCGGGQMRNWAHDLGLQYCGTDISKTRITADLQKFGGPDFLSDVHNLPLADNSFDLVYSAAVTEHLAAPHRAIQEIYRVLKPGSIYLGNCSFMEPWHDESYFHISPNGAAALLLQAGFEPIAIWPSEGYSGYKALLSMGNRATKTVRLLGRVMHGYSRMFFRLKRAILGAEKYTDGQMLADFAKTAGAIDWVARKPG